MAPSDQNLVRRNVSRAILSGICLLLLAGIAREWLVGSAPPRDSMIPQHAFIDADSGIDGQTPMAAPRPLAPAASYSQIVEHPLFVPSRRPWTPPSPLPKRNELPLRPPLPTWQEKVVFRLSGTVFVGERKVALLHNDRDRDVYRLREGETVLGWTLVEIRPRAVTLKYNEITKVVELEIAPGKKPSGKNATQDDGFEDDLPPP